VGANAKARNFYLRVKGELEQGISALGFSAFHIFRPSLLLGQRTEVRSGERVMTALASLFNLAMIGGLRRYHAIAASAVGQAMVAAAQRGGSGPIIYEYDSILDLTTG
jgi:uncharacterized protein YbjT (DUF2867 family)